MVIRATAAPQNRSSADSRVCAGSGQPLPSPWRLAPVDDRRAREIVLAVAERGVPEAAELAEAYQAACGDGGSRPALP